MPQLHDLHSTLQKACETLGITVDEAFNSIRASVPHADEMAKMPVSTWIDLCNLLCLSPDHALHGYDERLHRNLINRKNNIDPNHAGPGGMYESSYRGGQSDNSRNARNDLEDGRL